MVRPIRWDMYTIHIMPFTWKKQGWNFLKLWNRLRTIEGEGIIMPVAEIRTRFSFPLRFGDIITVESELYHPGNHPGISLQDL